MCSAYGRFSIISHAILHDQPKDGIKRLGDAIGAGGVGATLHGVPRAGPYWQSRPGCCVERPCFFLPVGSTVLICSLKY